MPRRLACLTLSAFAIAAPTAGAAVLNEPLPGVPGTTAIACHDGWRPGTAGVATRTVRVPAGPARIDVALKGHSGDWDVAVFDANHVVAAAAGRSATESALGYTLTGGRLRVQACRRTGDARVIPVTVTRTALTVPKNAAVPQLVSVHTPTRAAKDLLTSLGLDLSEHAGTDSVGVVLHDAADRATLKRHHLEYDVIVKDLVADSLKARRADARAATTARALPSGRAGTYRRLADYNAEMKALADANPSFVRTFVLPEKTLLGKEVLGLEISTNVSARDGKPVFLNMGVHHAREWPAGEMTLEWAYELIDGFNAKDPRATRIVRRSRNLVVPIVNPDGFEGSREAGELGGAGAGRDPAVDDLTYSLAGALAGGEYRRKNCRVPDDSDNANCAIHAALIEGGIDLNRNYASLWGGPGTSTDPTSFVYHGARPFSEAEARNIRDLVSERQVVTALSNHTTAALILRAPGLASLGDPVDEKRGYKALSDAMAKHTGYLSQKGFELYDTTGTAEDWIYNETGGFAYVIEIYCGLLNYDSGDCDAPAFHPTYALGVEQEWDGRTPVADHVADPGPNAGFDGQGNREAFYLAAESTLNAKRHSVIEGAAPPGATLRLTRSWKTEAFPENLTTDDKIETVYEVGDDGRFAWHINPSTRPIVAKERGKKDAGPPSPEETTTGDPTGSSETADGPDDGAALPAAALDPPPTASYNDHPFTIPDGDNASLTVSVEWMTPASDWDVFLYEDVDGNGRSDPATDREITVSGQGVSNFEEVTLAGDQIAPGTKYVLRVVNFAAFEPYTVVKTYVGFEPYQPARTERWTLTCEVGGRVMSTRRFVIERGERKTIAVCGVAPIVCELPPLRGVSAKPVAGGVRLRARRGTEVRIQRYSSGRTVDREVISRSRRWAGADEDGFYVVRFRRKGLTKHVVLERRDGRFRVGRRFRHDGCGGFKLSGPVFGGTTAVPLRITARGGVVVRRGNTVVKRGAGRLSPRGLPRGLYRVRSGGQTLYSRLI